MALAPFAQRLGNARTVGHKLSWLTQWVPKLVRRTVLTLVTKSHSNTVHAHNPSNLSLRPGGRLRWVLVKEVAAFSSLQGIEFHTKTNVNHGTGIFLSNNGWVTSVLIQMLPRTESRAHRRTNEKHRLLFDHHRPSTLPVLKNIKIPRLALLVLHGQVKSKAGNTTEFRQEFGHSRHPRWRVDLRHHMLDRPTPFSQVSRLGTPKLGNKIQHL